MSDKLDVRFHFPYAVISVISHEAQVRAWETDIINRRVFRVHDGKKKYLINSELLTYMETGPSLPF